MKKLITVILILAMLLPAAALAVTDLSGMSMEELLELQDSVRAEILSRSQWESVTVPVGYYVVGVDIPEGHWTIKCPENYALIEYYSDTDESGKNADPFGRMYFGICLGAPGNQLESIYNQPETDIELKAGYYVHISEYPLVFEPFTGRQSPFFN